jgi:hypothetical protein
VNSEFGVSVDNKYTVMDQIVESRAYSHIQLTWLRQSEQHGAMAVKIR